MVSKKNGFVLVLLDGEEPSSKMVNYFLAKASVVVVTDGAAHYAEKWSINIDVVIGDLDSITHSLRFELESRGVKIIERADQYSNDFEKALRYVLEEIGPVGVVVLGIAGKRTDHLLTNFSVLLRFTDQFASIVAYDQTHAHRFLTMQNNSLTIDAMRDTQVSLAAIPKAIGVRTVGLRYPIQDEQMVFGEREGLSNIIDSSMGAEIRITAGSLLISTPFSAE